MSKEHLRFALYADLSKKNIDADQEENVDALSTKADIDREELPPVSRLRICLQERRSKFLPLTIIFGGSVTVVIFVSRQ